MLVHDAKLLQLFIIANILLQLTIFPMYIDVCNKLKISAILYCETRYERIDIFDDISVNMWYIIENYILPSLFFLMDIYRTITILHRHVIWFNSWIILNYYATKNQHDLFSCHQKIETLPVGLGSVLDILKSYSYKTLFI